MKSWAMLETERSAERFPIIGDVVRRSLLDYWQNVNAVIEDGGERYTVPVWRQESGLTDDPVGSSMLIRAIETDGVDVTFDAELVLCKVAEETWVVMDRPHGFTAFDDMPHADKVEYAKRLRRAFVDVGSSIDPIEWCVNEAILCGEIV